MTPETMILLNGSEVIVTHFLVTADFGPGKIACVPGLTNFSASPIRAVPWIRSSELGAVNCPLCKKSKDYEIAIAAQASAKK